MAYSKARKLADIVDTSGVVSYDSLSDGTITVTAFADEDNMSSNSATLLSTQQSIKAYVDANAVTLTNEQVQDVVGAMLTGNTETGLTVTYEDGDGTIDFVVGTLNQDTTGTAALATTVTITDNENTNENNALIFTAGGDLDGGNLGLESDGDLTYNPSTGLLTATSFAGALTGNVTGNASGTAATVTGAAQSAITSLGTLTGLTVSGEASMTTLDIGGTNVTATAAELNYLDIATLGLTQASKAVTADANGVVTHDAGVSDEYTAVTSSSNATTIDCRVGNTFAHTLTENTTFTFSYPAASGKSTIFLLKLIQDSTARTVTWPGSVDWAAATAPTITATNAGVDILVFMTHDGGTIWYGFTAGQAMA